MQPNSWIRCTKPNPNARSRLFCFPYAGGGASIYRRWSTLLPEEIEVSAIQLPGRETRIRETSHTDLDELVTSLGQALLPLLDRPFIFFGHSMGTLIVYALTHYLQGTYGLLPQQLFVSGRRAPHVPDPELALHALPEDEFLRELQQRYDNIPSVVFDDAEMRSLFIPILRSDFTMIERYRPPALAPFSCPLTVFGGDSDPRASREILNSWSVYTKNQFRLEMLPGGHFYLNDIPETLVNRILHYLYGT